MRTGTPSFRGSLATSGAPKQSPRYDAGRTCRADGCTTRLSTYNRGDLCWAHQPVRFPLLRGRKKRPDPAG